MADQYAQALHSLGTTPESCVAILMRNKPEFLFTHYGNERTTPIIAEIADFLLNSVRIAYLMSSF